MKFPTKSVAGGVAVSLAVEIVKAALEAQPLTPEIHPEMFKSPYAVGGYADLMAAQTSSSAGHLQLFPGDADLQR
jgi:hypothetical protein